MTNDVNVNQGIASPITEKITLSRDLKLFTVTMIGVGGMIGAGIFVLTGIAAGVAGPALVLVFFLNGLVTLLTAMSYAELGAAFPVAGGSYRWVKQGLGDTQGFLAGWMSWFANAVAGALYALAFGRFATELILLAGVPTLGLSVEALSLGLMTLAIIIFTAINYRGASETGAIGNLVTMTKVFILGIFIILGLIAVFSHGTLVTNFTPFAPNGLTGVFVAMGLTFIAFEGYEIIAQSGEEVINPRRNIPAAIFLSIIIAVTIYILVGIAAIGAVFPPDGIQPYEYLGLQKEIAIIEVARQVFPFGSGAVIVLISALASTMSALNAITYSSSRVSFAMGRDHNLPGIFSKIHPERHTPYWAVIASGGLMMIMAWSLPIEDVAAAADIMFLMLFLQVNMALITMHRKIRNQEHGFLIPLFPLTPILAIAANALLAVNLFHFSPIAWYFAIGWVIIGLLAYFTHFSKQEAMERPKEILMEEVLVSRDYSVLVPVSSIEQARVLGQIGAVLAQSNGGEILALNVVQVPPQLTLGEGRYFLREGRAYLDAVIEQAKVREVPVHTIIRLGRNVAEAIRTTAIENASDLIVLGWPGYTTTAGRLYGTVIDQITDDPPTDVALVRYRERRPIRSILVPVGGGPNSRRAVRMAVQMATTSEEGPVKITLLHVVPVGSHNSDLVRAKQVLDYVMEGISYQLFEPRIAEGAGAVDTILQQAESHDLIVMGSTEEPLFQNLLMGNVAEQVAKRAKVTVVMVKRRSGPLHSFLRQTVLEPSTASEGDNGVEPVPETETEETDVD